MFPHKFRKHFTIYMAFLLVTPYDNFSISNCNKNFCHKSSSTLLLTLITTLLLQSLTSFPSHSCSTCSGSLNRVCFVSPTSSIKIEGHPLGPNIFRNCLHFLANFKRFKRSSSVISPFLWHWKYPSLCFFKHLLIASFETLC